MRAGSLATGGKTLFTVLLTGAWIVNHRRCCDATKWTKFELIRSTMQVLLSVLVDFTRAARLQTCELVQFRQEGVEYASQVGIGRSGRSVCCGQFVCVCGRSTAGSSCAWPCGWRPQGSDGSRNIAVVGSWSSGRGSHWNWCRYRGFKWKQP